MRRKIIIVTLFLTIAGIQQIKSQVLIGLLFGEKLNKGPIEFGVNVIGNSSNTTISSGADNRNKLGFGLYLGYKMSEKFIFSTGFFFASPKGQVNFGESDPYYYLTDSLFAGANTERVLNYFEVPLLLEIRPIPRWGIGVGGYLSIMTRAYDYYKVSRDNGDGDILHERSILENMNRFDYGLTGSVHYHFKGEPGSKIRFSYMLGLTNILKDSDINSYNEVFRIGWLIPIKFGLASSAEKSDVTE